jgi:DNA-directed RNA polymerase specialized sigma24 family protein
MLTNSSNSDQESVTLERATRIRAVIAEEHEALLRSVAVLIARTEPRLRWPEVMDRASELLHEAVQESLQHAFAFDPSRSATAWVRGIAARLLLTRRRAEARGRRCVSASVLGEATWVAALRQLCAGSTEGAVAGRLDLEAAIRRISPEKRHAIEWTP